METFAQKLYLRLLGTCDSLDDAIESLGRNYEDLNQDTFKELDSLVLQCEVCSWWVEAHEISDGECVDCRH